ncbi:MAG: hypothetical protein ACQ9MH_13685 [Nitrospinales bacterium]
MFKSICMISLILLPLNSAFGGNLSGQVIYSGKIPAPKVFNTGKYAKACGPEIKSQSLLVKDKGVKNAVISISGKGAKKLKSSSGEYTLNQENCVYSPHVVVMPKESELEIKSSDPINHNIHTYSFDNDPVNLMFMPGMEHEQEFEESEIVKVECDLHGWMQAWIVVTDNSFFAKTNDDGSFEIPDLPPGKYTLTAWHEVLGTMTQKIKIDDKGLKVNFEFPEISTKVSQK